MKRLHFGMLGVIALSALPAGGSAAEYRSAAGVSNTQQADASNAYSKRMVAERPELGIILQHFGYKTLAELNPKLIYRYNIDTGNVTTTPVPPVNSPAGVFIGLANNTGGITDNGIDIVGYARSNVFCIVGGADTAVGGYLANGHSRDPSNPTVIKWGIKDAGGASTVNFAVLMAAGGAKNLANNAVMETTHIAECGGEVQTVNQFRNWPAVRYSMVIDDTGSMSAQLTGVKGGLASFISDQTQAGDVGRAKIYELISFKDVPVQRLAPTTDAAAALTAIQGLYPDGGGDCPEDSIGAVNLALAGIESDESARRSIILATDASPLDGSDIAGVIARAKANGVSVNVMLSGDCAASASAAASSNMGGAGSGPSSISSRVELKRLAEETGGIYFYSPSATAADYAAQFKKILMDSENPMEELLSGVAVTGLAGEAGSTRSFRIEVPAGISSLRVITYGGSGDLSLYTRKGVVATPSGFDQFSTRVGTNSESIQVPAPPAGTYYVTIVGVSAYSGAAIRAVLTP